MASFAVYILANRTRKLYVGVTSDLQRRVYAHKSGALEGFSRKYKIDQLVSFELTPNASAAIEREKAIKGWSRAKKISLIEESNLGWLDLAADWYGHTSK